MPLTIEEKYNILRNAAGEALAEVTVAKSIALPEDDPIIADHVRRAEEELRIAFRTVEA